MALNTTIFKAAIQLSDLDRNDYWQVDLVLAYQPSETESYSQLEANRPSREE